MNTKKNFFAARQQEELDASLLYYRIAQAVKNADERETLLAISADEKKHAGTFQKYSGRTLKPNRVRTALYLLLGKITGYTFLIKQLEMSEDKGIEMYRANVGIIPELEQILADEETHENRLIDLLDEERLHYTGDVILGMNDALVELTGSLAGYTLAMQNCRIIAMAGLITGISATLSMAGSGYLSARENDSGNAVKSTVIIGLSYLITVVLLILPYLLFPPALYLNALITTVIIALCIIATFNYYISVAKGRGFKKGFLSMAGISLGVAVISFGVGYFVKHMLGIDL
ncbi:MAG TPA: rubrerythrin family protein [Treponema sp.]|nr:rubrerythrin family protein [Treponema sp.]